MINLLNIDTSSAEAGKASKAKKAHSNAANAKAAAPADVMAYVMLQMLDAMNQTLQTSATNGKFAQIEVKAQQKLNKEEQEVPLDDPIPQGATINTVNACEQQTEAYQQKRQMIVNQMLTTRQQLTLTTSAISAGTDSVGQQTSQLSAFLNNLNTVGSAIAGMTH